MLLKKLIKNCPKNINKLDINGLELDSRKIKKGNLFFAIKGSELNGVNFIKDASERGAVLIICDSKIDKKKFKVPILIVKNIKLILIEACVNFFKNKPKNIIAVTGTNGKSSVANFFHQILLINHKPVASIGTLGLKINNKNFKSNLTSPDIISLHKILEKIKKKNIENVIIEASSHGLQQGRLDGINFMMGIFTNFSQDHLDYHKTMKQYFLSKMILFSKLLKKNRIVITDTDNKEFSKLKKIANKKRLKVVTINKKSLENNNLKTKLIGSFQLKNLEMSKLAANFCGLSKNKINKSIEKLKSVDGRMDLIKVLPNKSKIFVDFAHTPDALLTALDSLYRNFKSQITLVFGCGGERDKKKRAIMAKIASKYCNKIIVTDDNPRNENPRKIRKQIIKNLKNFNYQEIPDRKKAIETAIKDSSFFDIILIAGKGHENTQDYGKRIIICSDKDIINNVKIKQKRYVKKQINNIHNSKILNLILKNKKKYNYEGVTINSREVKKNNLFIAIRGKKKDGHNYIKDALAKRANYCVASNEYNSNCNKKIIKHKNTFDFLNRLAFLKRKFSKAKIIAVTGSAGKTSAKDLLGNFLSEYSSTHFSPKSFNNQYGVPISLSNLEANHTYGVFEVGMSKAGEISNLSKIIKPDIAIITNIAEAHIENFKNIKGIAKAKAEIINNVKKNGFLIINKDCKFFNFFMKIGKKRGLNIVSFGFSKKADIHLLSIKKINKITYLKIKVEKKDIFLKIKNINIHNILSSLAVLKVLDLDINKISKSNKFYKLLAGRGKVHNIKRYRTKFKLIDESYNANPLSVKNAINNFAKIEKNDVKKYLLLGDMLELGIKSDFYHKNLSKFINNTDIDKVFVYGDKILNTYKNIKKNKQGNILQHPSDFDEMFSKIIKRNDYLMIKGSNSTGLNTMTKNIIKGSLNVI